MNNLILEAQQLSFQYPAASPIYFPDISITHSQHSLLLGDSGSGKTTLLHLVGGLSKPSSGTVQIAQQDIYAKSTAQLDQFRAQHIGFIFQDAHLLSNLTLLENIKLAQSLAHKSVEIDRIRTVLDQLQLQDKEKSLPSQLSRGQLQRAAIARAIINGPQLLLADEPTAALDDRNTAQVLSLLLETAQKYKATLLIATHDKRIKDHFDNTYQL